MPSNVENSTSGSTSSQIPNGYSDYDLYKNKIKIFGKNNLEVSQVPIVADSLNIGTGECYMWWPPS